MTTLADLGEHRAHSAISAANLAPRAPPHLEMTNNILGASGTGGAFSSASQISGIQKAEWKRLRKHMQLINESPHQMCYNVSDAAFCDIVARDKGGA